MSFRCLLVDDDPIFLDGLEVFAKKLGKLQIEALCNSGVEALNILLEKEIDIVFSDIEMPGLNALELIRSLKKPPVFVLISSHREYAVEGFELNVADYLLKPLDFPRFVRAAERAIEICRLQKTPPPEEAEPDYFSDKDDHFIIKSDSSYIKIKYTDLVSVESLGNYCKLYIGTEKFHLALISMKKLEDLLGSDFMRIHRSYLVRLSAIKEVSPGEVIADGKKIPVGLSYKTALMEKVVNNKLINRL